MRFRKLSKLAEVLQKKIKYEFIKKLFKDPSTIYKVTLKEIYVV